MSRPLQPYRVGSLFSGIGGLELGLERAGMSVAWQVEIDPFCRRVLAKHWPDVPRYEDVHDVDSLLLEPVDIIAGGFPCQPFSFAGKGLAQDDPRWLWPEFRRIVGDLRPSYVLLENVTAILARGFGDVLGDLAALGYDAEWDCLPAATFGAPQRRDRVFVIAYPNGGRRRGSPERHVLPPARLEPSRRRNIDGLDLVKVGSWSTLPGVLRVDYGTPDIVDRLRSLGNAVVPQVAEWIGRQILQAAPQPAPASALGDRAWPTPPGGARLAPKRLP